ncbi:MULTISPECIES: hypothetical protein [Pseudomonas]|nr:MULTISPECIES: hypothetical protein [Pseudomonas]
MSPEEMKAELKRKGWTNKDLSVRWKVSATWVSKIINDPERSPHYDDAVRGLPTVKKPKNS